jgi:hypothetical protein
MLLFLNASRHLAPLIIISRKSTSYHAARHGAEAQRCEPLAQRSHAAL